MVLFVFLSIAYGVFQTLLLASGTRSIGWRSVAAALLAGISASAALTLPIQYVGAYLLSSGLKTSFDTLVATSGYLQDPFVEELCKPLPLILLLAFAPRLRKALGVTDIVVLCAALGAGFGFTESALSFGNSAAGASWSHGHWVVAGGGFDTTIIPGPTMILTAWLPAGTGVDRPFADPELGVNLHLALSTMVGLGLGLALNSDRWKWLILPLFFWAGLEHAAFNAAANHQRLPLGLPALFAGLDKLAGFYIPIALAAAMAVDHGRLRLAIAAAPDLILPDERDGPLGLTRLALRRLGQGRLPLDLWRYVLTRRAFALAQASGGAGAWLDPAREKLVDLGRALQADPPAARAFSFITKPQPAAASPPLLRQALHKLRLGIIVVLATPPVLFFVVGNFPLTSWVQRLFANPLLLQGLAGLAVLAVCYQLVAVSGRAASLARNAGRLTPQALLTEGLAVWTGLGGAAFGLAAIAAFAATATDDQAALVHLIEHFREASLLTKVMAALGLVLIGVAAFGLAAPGIALTALEAVAPASQVMASGLSTVAKRLPMMIPGMAFSIPKSEWDYVTETRAAGEEPTYWGYAGAAAKGVGEAFVETYAGPIAGRFGLASKAGALLVKTVGSVTIEATSFLLNPPAALSGQDLSWASAKLVAKTAAGAILEELTPIKGAHTFGGIGSITRVGSLIPSLGHTLGANAKNLWRGASLSAVTNSVLDYSGDAWSALNQGLKATGGPPSAPLPTTEPATLSH